MDKSMEYYQKAEEQKHKAEYLGTKSNREITLAMPESIEVFFQETRKGQSYTTKG